MLTRRLAGLMMILMASSCADYRSRIVSPATKLPDYEPFVSYYQLDATNANIQSQAEYLLWVERFYQGWELYPRGWNSLTDDLLSRIVDPFLAQTIKVKLDTLGSAIAAEWAKDNSTRRIATQQVSIWGNALLNSLQHADTLRILDYVAHDVADLLAKRISADVITDNRFYTEEDIFKDIN